MYPQADIPVVQVSLPTRGGPALQTRVGHALASLREHGVLLIGSGSITHNLRELDWHAGPESVEPWAKVFRDWVIEKLEANDEAALHDYRQQAPNAARNHPSDEHLLPLYFARAAGGEFSIAHQGFTMGGGAGDGHLSLWLTGRPNCPLREQARSHTGSASYMNSEFTEDQVWERACSRRRRLRSKSRAETADKKIPEPVGDFFMFDQSARERINLRDSDAASTAYRQRECPSAWSGVSPDHLPAARRG